MEQKSTKSIDEQLAEANKAFDERLKAERADTKPESVAVALPEGAVVRPKPQKQIVRPKAQKHRPGDFAHYHPNETEYEIVDMPCYYVEHVVRDRKGFMINDVRYRGKIVVPQCTANYLAMMESRHQTMERGVFEDRGRQVNLGELRG